MSKRPDIFRFQQGSSPVQMLEAYKDRFAPDAHDMALREHPYWVGALQPEALVMGTNSTRKMLMAMALAAATRTGTLRPQDHFPHYPELNIPFHVWLTLTVANGDGSIPYGIPPIPLGTIFGVPLWGLATRGEGHKNSLPINEAAKKGTNALVALEELAQWLSDQRTVALAMDTTEKAHINLENNQMKVISHGKPYKHPDFVGRESEWQERGWSSLAEWKKAFDRFTQTFIQEGYPPGALIEHVVALFGLPSSPGTFSVDIPIAREIKKAYRVTPGMFDHVTIDPDSAGGGITQQVIFLLEKYRDLSPLDQIIATCHIMGMPLYSALRIIKVHLPQG